MSVFQSCTEFDIEIVSGDGKECNTLTAVQLQEKSPSLSEAPRPLAPASPSRGPPSPCSPLPCRPDCLRKHVRCTSIMAQSWRNVTCCAFAVSPAWSHGVHTRASAPAPIRAAWISAQTSPMLAAAGAVAPSVHRTVVASENATAHPSAYRLVKGEELVHTRIVRIPRDGRLDLLL